MCAFLLFYDSIQAFSEHPFPFELFQKVVCVA